MSQLGYSAAEFWDFRSQTSDKRMNETVEVLVTHLLIYLSHEYLLRLCYTTGIFLDAGATVVSKTKSPLF